MPTLTKPQTKILGIDVRPEMQLILCCARNEIDEADAQLIKTLIQQENIDWQAVISYAYKNGLMPLLYTNLNAIAPETVPKDALNLLRQLFYANTQRSLLLAGELVKILGLLQEQEIIAVPYKGPVLATSLYGNVGLREFCDLDIIVQQQDVLKVKKVLLAQGYRPKVEMTEPEEIAYLKSKGGHTYDFIDLDKGILIEVHWRITPEYTSPIEPKHFWKNLKPFSFAGLTVPYLPLEDWLLILCVHGSRHRWQKLSWPFDIAQLIRITKEINWQKLIQEANEFDCKRMLFIGLFLAHHFAGITLPADVLKQIAADSEVNSLGSAICQELLSKDYPQKKVMARTVYQIRVRERLENKFLYFQCFLRWLLFTKDKN
jgi:hypothetical protein